MDQSLFFLMIFLLVMAAYYSFVIFPKQREFRKKQRDISALQVGDEVVTFGGLIGKIVDIDTEIGVASVEIAPNVTSRILIAALMQKYDPDEIAQAARATMQNAPLPEVLSES